MTRVFLQLANLSITASFLILGVLVLRLLLRKVPKNLFLWMWALVGIRLALPFSLESALSLIPKAQPIPLDIGLSPAPAISSGISMVDNALNPVIAENFTPSPAASANPLQVVLPIAAALWLTGVVFMVLYQFLSYCRLSRKVRVSLPLERNIYLCDGIPTPFLLGLLRPRIYLPSEMDSAHRAFVLKHEYAHLRHHDNWWKLLGFLLLSVYWFQPLVWVSYLLFCRDLEIACDERAVKDLGEEDRKAYSYALLACAAPRHTISVCPVAFGETSVKSRIRNVLRFQKATIWISALVFLIAAITAICFLTNPKAEETPSAEAEEVAWQVYDAPPNGSYTYQNRELQLHFDNVSRVLTRTLQDENGKSYTQTALMIDHAGSVSVMLPNSGQGFNTWQLCESTGTLDATSLTGSVSRLFLTNNTYDLYDPDHRQVLLIRRGARLSTENGVLRPETAQAALVMDARTGEIVYSYQPSQRVSARIANRLALALAVLEDHNPEEMVDTRGVTDLLEGNDALSFYATACDPNLEEMETVSLEALVNLAIMAAGTHYDAVCALARFGAGSEEAMVAKMNDYVSAICPNTHFTDIHGITEGQYTTAEDLLTLVNRALKHPFLSKVWSSRSVTLDSPALKAKRLYPTRNYMMDDAVIPDFYDTRVTGGFATNNDLVCTAGDDGRELICILLGAERRMDEEIDWVIRYYGNFEEMGALLNTVFEE